MTSNPLEVIEHLARVTSDHDLDAIVACFAEDYLNQTPAHPLRGFRGRFDLGHDFVYGIFSSDESEAVGGNGLHTRRGEGVFEIGYWIRASRVGEGLCTEATAALTRVGFEVCEIERIEIRVDPANEASLAIPRKLGFVEEGTMRGVFHDSGGTPRASDAVVFALLRGEFQRDVELTAFDAAGERVL